MNYIAHIHIAHQTQTSLEGNFLGDFVKGSDLSHLPFDIQNGVRLHRSIDSFTDQHQQVNQLKSLFPSSLRRVSGICIDVFFDHFLYLHWDKYCEVESDALLSQFYAQLADSQLDISEQYEKVKKGLLEYRWLENYAHPQGVTNALFAIERRLKGKLYFAQQGSDFLIQYKQAIEGIFLTFYPELIQFASNSKYTQNETSNLS